DPTIEPGGVYIETDMGDIDATINAQLEELERQMRFYVPIKPKAPRTPETTPPAEEAPVIEELPPTNFAQTQPSYGNDIPEEMRYVPEAETTSPQEAQTVVEPALAEASQPADVAETISEETLQPKEFADPIPVETIKPLSPESSETPEIIEPIIVDDVPKDDTSVS
ncbi:MAG: FliH/SctL family protein, partial [Brevinema sp.]